MADQVVLMRAGHIEQDGSPADLYERPATIFTARFVGTPPMNVLPATALGAAWENLKATAPAGRPPAALAVGVRAEAARLAPSGVAARVAAIEYLGADSLIDTRIGEAPFIVRLAGRSPVALGEQVSIAWDAGASHWFDATSGQRIN
jgi:sn-glycerol 3-phosphate transport system ATP-binding protein